MKSQAYLAQIRKSEGLKRAIIEKIEIDKTKITFTLLTDLPYQKSDEDWALSCTKSYVPEGYEAQVIVKKLVAASDLVIRKTKELLDKYHPATSAFILLEDIEAEAKDGHCTVRLGFTEMEQKLVGQNVLDTLAERLQKVFCGTFSVTTFLKEKEDIVMERKVEEEEFRPTNRLFEIEEFEPIDGIEEIPKYATYMVDGAEVEGEMNFCGSITHVDERETQKGKPFFRFTITDGTAMMRVMYFTKKSTYEKVKGLEVGDWILCSGTNEIWNGSYSFHVKKLNLARQIKDFVPEKRKSRDVPKAYHTVFPEEITDYSQDDLFGKDPLPEDFLSKEFVVFDLETTGLNNSPIGGTVDKIIEVGAVRIKDGKIKEKFSSFVLCPNRLSREIVALTGISDDMLVGAPSVEKVLLDFYKFTDGAILVGHNVMFDYKFISYYGEQSDIRFDTKLYDTVTIAQNTLSLANYKLNTVAEHFGVTFNHHRAFDDALATAKIFIELIRIKKCLPN